MPRSLQARGVRLTPENFKIGAPAYWQRYPVMKAVLELDRWRAAGASRLSESRLMFFVGAGLRVFNILRSQRMCRNIKILFNFDPPVTAEEIRAASLQFVRKISGFNKPSKANEASFMAAVDEIAGISTRLLRSLETNAPSRNREEETAKARARAAERFGT